jgi:CheY-like chemotaxis protein
MPDLRGPAGEHLAGNPSILVVDDEPAICWALARLFSREGYAVCTVQSGADALALLAEQCFTHVLLDAKLQDMDGLALARQARQLDPRAWVFLISAYYYRDDPDISRALAEGVIHGFIPKPFTHSEIMDSIQDYGSTSIVVEGDPWNVDQGSSDVS